MKVFARLLLWLSVFALAGASTAEAQEAANEEKSVDRVAVPGFPGSFLYLPRGGRTHPAVVILHGSEGGKLNPFTRADAEEMARMGYAAMTFCWYGCEGTPGTVQRVPIDRTLEAIRWLKKSKYVDGKRVGLFGVSRGAEQALIIGSLIKKAEDVAAIAVHAPSDTVVTSFDPEKPDDVPTEQDPKTGRITFAPAWTYQGEALHGELRPVWGSGPRIRVEDYEGPLYVSHGTKDEVWEVDRTRRIERTRKQARRPTEVRYFEGQGHVFDSDKAFMDNWDGMMSFFRANLAGPPNAPAVQSPPASGAARPVDAPRPDPCGAPSSPPR